jgi:hypothetical protein
MSVECVRCKEEKEQIQFYPSQLRKRVCKVCNDKGVVERKRRRREENAVVNFINTSHSRMWSIIHRGVGRSKVFDHLPYDRDELIAHLVSTIPEGMTWDDYSSGRLELDHIVDQICFPCTDYSDPEFAERWALSNLRLIPKEENRQRRKVRG